MGVQFAGCTGPLSKPRSVVHLNTTTTPLHCGADRRWVRHQPWRRYSLVAVAEELSEPCVRCVDVRVHVAVLVDSSGVSKLDQAGSGRRSKKAELAGAQWRHHDGRTHEYPLLLLEGRKRGVVEEREAQSVCLGVRLCWRLHRVFETCQHSPLIVGGRL